MDKKGHRVYNSISVKSRVDKTNLWGQKSERPLPLLEVGGTQNRMSGEEAF